MMKRKNTDLQPNPSSSGKGSSSKSDYIGDPKLLSRVRQVNKSHMGDNRLTKWIWNVLCGRDVWSAALLMCLTYLLELGGSH